MVTSPSRTILRAQSDRASPEGCPAEAAIPAIPLGEGTGKVIAVDGQMSDGRTQPDRRDARSRLQNFSANPTDIVSEVDDSVFLMPWVRKFT